MRGMLAISVLLFALAVAYWLGADAIPKSSLGGAVGADGLPKLLAVALGLLSLGLAAQTLLEIRKRRRTGASSGTVEVSSQAGNWYAHARAFGIIAIGIVFVAVLPYLGYAVSVALLLMSVVIYAGRKPSLTTLVFGIAGAAFFYVMFVHLLKVPLPPGIWPSMLGA